MIKKASQRGAGSLHRGSDLQFWSPGRIRTGDLPTMSRILGVKLDGAGRIEPAQVGCLVAPEDSSSSLQKTPEGSSGCSSGMIIHHPMPTRMQGKQTATALGFGGGVLS
jgi:hypothetical protein